jgi:TorA maturation chaperone TorD
MIDNEEITVSGISFNHGTNGEYEFYAHTDHTGVLWQAWRHLHGRKELDGTRACISRVLGEWTQS